MKWLIDAQLPKRQADRLIALGHDAQHTLDLPSRNRTTDAEINQLADGSGRVVASKDRDFLDSHLVTGSPARLLWVTTGNIANDELIALFESQLADVEAAFAHSSCVELSATRLTLHQ